VEARSLQSASATCSAVCRCRLTKCVHTKAALDAPNTRQSLDRTAIEHTFIRRLLSAHCLLRICVFD